MVYDPVNKTYRKENDIRLIHDESNKSDANLNVRKRQLVPEQNVIEEKSIEIRKITAKQSSIRERVSNTKNRSRKVPYICDICNKCFSQFTELENHMFTHSRSKPYACDQCDSRYANSFHLSHHKKTAHEGIRAYSCEICGKHFAQSSNVKKHMLVHTGERPYRCSYCRKKFTRMSDMEMHKKTVHQGIYSHACKECGKCYCQIHHLRKHLLTHDKQRPQSEKPYACDQCSESYSSSSNLETHKKWTHQRTRSHVCEICGKCYLWKNHLKRHFSVHNKSPR